MAEGNKVAETSREDQRLAEGENLEEQVNELIALESIYTTDIEICKHNNPKKDMPGGIVSILIFPPEGFHVKITKDMPGIRKLAFSRGRGRGRGKKSSMKSSQPSTPLSDHATKSSTEMADKTELYPIRRLPPITLTFAFPYDYPCSRPPIFTLSSSWLEKRNLTRLCQKLDSIWSECRGSVVIMNWISFLQDELLSYLALSSPYDLGRVLVHLFTHPAHDAYKANLYPGFKPTPFDIRGIQTFSNLEEVLPTVLNWNILQCDVCFEEKGGKEFIHLVNCKEHHLCKRCMGSWFESRIAEGDVTDLKCPGYKCDKAVMPTEIASIVSEETYQRYDKLLLKTAFDLMTDVIMCPRPFCQFPVMLEDNLGICPKCQHAFCGRCQNTYHGHTPCKLKAEMYAALCEEYESCDQDRKVQLELRYGKQLIQRALDERNSNMWLESNSKQCPSCGTYIQKKDGCNKMTCIKCRAYFCWLCQAELSRSNPYAHYQHPTSPCSNRLFEGVVVPDIEEDEDEFMLWLEDDDDDDNDDVGINVV